MGRVSCAAEGSAPRSRRTPQTAEAAACLVRPAKFVRRGLVSPIARTTSRPAARRASIRRPTRVTVVAAIARAGRWARVAADAAAVEKERCSAHRRASMSRPARTTAALATWLAQEVACAPAGRARARAIASCAGIAAFKLKRMPHIVAAATAPVPPGRRARMGYAAQAEAPEQAVCPAMPELQVLVEQASHLLLRTAFTLPEQFQPLRTPLSETRQIEGVSGLR